MKYVKIAVVVLAIFLCFAVNANATLVDLGPGSFTPAASVITFSEFALGTVNPTYNVGGITITFDGNFVGGLGTPTEGSPLALDSASPDTFITTDSDNPTSPILSGTSRFYGPIAVLFSQPVAAVGLDGGYFNAIGGTTIAAYDENGYLLGSIGNSELGIEFFGLGDDSGDEVIAGIQFYITGEEPYGYAIDNLTFGFKGDYSVPEPATMLLLGTGLFGLAALGRKKFFKKG